MHNSRFTYTLILVAACLWCAAILLAPLLAAKAASVSGGIYAFFHLICHQYDVRSLHISGHPLAVCSRCSAIYFAFLAGVIVYPFFRTRMTGTTRRLLMVAALPMVLDVAGGMIGISQPSNILRVVTGAVFGLVSALIILPDAIEASRTLMLRFTDNPQQHGDTDASKAQ